MAHRNHASAPAPKQKLGFLLTIGLIWLSVQAIFQSLNIFLGITVLPDALRGELPLLTGFIILVITVAVPAVFVLTIVFLLRRRKAFYVTFALCILLSTLINFFSRPIDSAAVIALLLVLLIDAAIWVLFFVSDRVRTRFGLPVLHPQTTLKDT